MTIGSGTRRSDADSVMPRSAYAGRDAGMRDGLIPILRNIIVWESRTMPIRAEYSVLLKCGCIESTMGMVHTLGDGKDWYQSCWKHREHSLIVRTYKTYADLVELWRYREHQRDNPTLF